MSEDLDRLDRLACEKVLGWTDHDRVTYSIVNEKKWQPTRNIAQAWELLERLGYQFRIDKLFPELKNGFRCELFFESKTLKNTYASAETAPLAITRACLKAAGVECD